MSAQRIASLLAGGTEILYGLGLGDRVVAVSHECDYPPEAAAKPRVTQANVDDSVSSNQIDEQVRAWTSAGNALYSIDVQTLADLRPDLIITQSQCDVCAVSYDDVMSAVREWPELHSAKVVDLNPTSLNAIFQDILRVGEAAGVGKTAVQYVRRLKARVETIRGCTQALPVSERLRVVCIEWIEPLMLAGNWMPELIDIAGGRCALVEAGRHSGYAEWPAVCDYDPQVIVIAPCGFECRRAVAEAAALADLPSWQQLSAVRNQRVFAADGAAYFNRSGPRIIDSLELLTHFIYPDIIAPPLGTAEVLWARLVRT